MEFEKDISLLPFESDWSDLGNWGELSKYITIKIKIIKIFY